MHLRGHFVEIGCVHQARGLILNGFHQMRVTMAQNIDCNAARKIEPLVAVRIK